MLVRWFYSHCPQSSPAPPPAPGCLGLSFAARKGDHRDYRLVLMIFIISWQQLAEIMTIDPQGPFTAGDHGGCTHPIPGLIFHPI